jgi:hypothetical protein
MHAAHEVAFPSGAMVPALPGEAACLHCHQGTRAGESVDAAAGEAPPDGVLEGLSFINVHYHIAAATSMGGLARGAYQYPGRAYAGRYPHVRGFESCVECHDAHDLGLDPLACATCHSEASSLASLRDIRSDTTDYDGDGDRNEGIAREIAHFQDILYAAIKEYARQIAGKPIVYNSERFPYFFVDEGEGDEVGPQSLSQDLRYDAWTPRLLRAAFNYQFVRKDPGAYAHNPRYALQVLHDSLTDLEEAIPVAGLEGLRRP